MPRDVDEKKTRKALRKLRKAKSRAEAEGIELTDWESEFVEGVEERLNKYGSAFADPSLGNTEDALSNAQSEILRQLDKKSRGKSNGGFKTRKPLKAKKGMKAYTPRVRQLDEEVSEETEQPETPDLNTKDLPAAPKDRLKIVSDTPDPPKSSSKEQDPPTKSRPMFRVIDGGKGE